VLSFVSNRGLHRFACGPIAQSVEQLAFNQWVAGSSPARLTTFLKRPLKAGDIQLPALRFSSNKRGDYTSRSTEYTSRSTEKSVASGEIPADNQAKSDCLLELEMLDDLDKLQGAWNVMSLESEGVKMPATIIAGATIVVEGSRFRSLGMAGTYEGTLELETGCQPKTFDLVFTAGHAAGHRNLGIYQLEGDRWTICLAINSDTRPEKFQTTAGSGYALETLERAPVTRKSKKKSSLPGEAAGIHRPSTQGAGEPATSDSPGMTGATELEGEWEMTSGIFNGAAMDKSILKWCKRVTRGNVTRVIAGPQVFLHATFTLDCSHQPPFIDYVNLEAPHKSRSQTGIFDLSGDTLQICMSAPEQPRPADFSSQPGDNLTYTAWRRVKA
jgi:uncharacterized protein (TIGR03067 family)